jgi:hypothetical protein
MVSTFRSNFARLAAQLIYENKVDSAVSELNKCFKIFPIEQVPMNYWTIPLIEQYYRAKQIIMANGLTQRMFDNVVDEARYYFQFKGNFANNIDSERQMCLYMMNQQARITEAFGQKDLRSIIQSALQSYMHIMNTN